MSAKFMTAVLSIGALIATLSVAAPAQAGHDREFKRFLGAAVGLYILGQALENQHHHKYRKKYRHQNNNWNHNNGRYNPCGQYHWDRKTNTCWRYR